MCFDSGQHPLWAMFIEEIWRNPNVKFHTVSFQLVTTPHYLLLATLLAIFLHRGHLRLMELKYNMWTHISKNGKKIQKDNVCVKMFLKIWENLEQWWTVHVSDPLGSSPFAQFFGVHSGSPPCQGQRRCGGTKNSGKANKNGEIIRKPWEIYEILWISMRIGEIYEIQIENLWKCVSLKKVHWEVHRRVSFQRPIFNFECVKPFVAGQNIAKAQCFRLRLAPLAICSVRRFRRFRLLPSLPT